LIVLELLAKAALADLLEHHGYLLGAIQCSMEALPTFNLPTTASWICLGKLLLGIFFGSFMAWGAASLIFQLLQIYCPRLPTWSCCQPPWVIGPRALNFDTDAEEVPVGC
jgi:hypothetical protein